MSSLFDLIMLIMFDYVKKTLYPNYMLFLYVYLGIILYLM